MTWNYLLSAIQADMAPRKRTTRQHKVDPKMAKLEAFLQDFDCEGTFRFVLVPVGHKTLELV